MKFTALSKDFRREYYRKELLAREIDCDLTDVELIGKAIKQVQIWSMDANSVLGANLCHALSSSCAPTQTLWLRRGLTGSDTTESIMSKQRQRKCFMLALQAAQSILMSVLKQVGKNKLIKLLEKSQRTFVCLHRQTHAFYQPDSEGYWHQTHGDNCRVHCCQMFWLVHFKHS